MIKYALLCERDHSFEAWFSSAAGYDRQAEAGQIVCPACGSADIRKALMTPNVATSKKRAQMPGAAPQEITELVRAFRRHVTENADYVGPQFPEEARKIHFGETEPRGIYGEATPAEAKALLDEGVQVAPLPKLPEDLS
jgi:hypothetical protein